MTIVARRSPADVTAFERLAPEDQARVRSLIAESVAPQTRRSYKSHLKGWVAWCEKNGHPHLPASPETVAAYLSYLAERKPKPVRPSSLRAIKSAIGTSHNITGYANPTTTELVKRTLQGIDRKHQGGRVKRARAITGEEVLRMAATSRGEGKEIADKRDAAIMLAAYGIAARRSEVVALDVDDLERRRDGRWIAHIRRGKTDQTGIGKEAEIPPEAIEAILTWMVAAGITSGPIFRAFSKNSTHVLPRRLSGQSFNLIAKQRAAAAGIDTSHGPAISGHSFRRGPATELAEAGGTVWELQALGRWASPVTPGSYVEWRRRIENLSERLGLKRAAEPTTERSEQ